MGIAQERLTGVLSGDVPRPAGRRSGRRGVVSAVLAVLLLACVAVDPSTPPAAAEAEGLRLVGSLPVNGAITLVVDPGSRRLIALENDRLDAYDAMTLEKVATTQLSPYRTGFGANAVHAWAPGQNRLYLLVYSALPGGGADTAETSPLLAIVDPVTLKVESVRAISPRLFPHGVGPVGMSYYAPENRLYVVGQSITPLAGDYTVMLTEIDIARAAAWTAPFAVGSACGKLISTKSQAAVHRLAGTSRVYFGCGTGNALATPQPGLPGIARVDISNPASPTVTRFGIAGTYGLGDAMFDPVAGRLVLISTGVAFPYQAAWVFDEAHEAVVGIVNAGNRDIQSSGLDPVAGRVYVGVKTNELLSAAYRGRRVPQATSVQMPPSLASGTIISIPFAHRLAIPRLVGKGTPGDPVRNEFSVYEHDLPDYVPPPGVDLDGTTVDVAEAPGKTDATFGADAKAFGARVHQVAGVNGVLQQVFNGEYWASTGGKTGLNDGDRDVHFSRVARARLAQREASASAMTTDGDANTKADFAFLTKGSWPYTAAACADLGTGRTKGTAPDASTTCDAGASLVEAKATHENNRSVPFADAATPLVSFGSSSSSSTLKRDSKAGLVVETSAESKDVVFGGVAKIGRITSVARSAAKGRPGTAAATYERAFENVTMPGYSCAKDCDPQAVVDRLNDVVPQLSAELPAFELTRSPRGARGSALRDPWQHEQDLLLNNESDTALEIPALRVSYVHDNATRSRVIFEFAATMANSSYSIYRLAGVEVDEGVPSLEAPLADLFAGSEVVIDNVTPPDPTILGDVPPKQVGELTSDRSERSSSFGRRLGHGLRLLLTGRRALILNALLWSLLLLPTFLIGRRRHLLRLIGGSR